MPTIIEDYNREMANVLKNHNLNSPKAILDFCKKGLMHAHDSIEGGDLSQACGDLMTALTLVIAAIEQLSLQEGTN